MSQADLHDAVSSARSINISGAGGNGFIILQPQISPPVEPATGCKLYADGNNNISWKNAQGNIFTLNVVSTTTSRTWTMPDSSSELATVDSLVLKEDKSKKGQPLGYASLGTDGKVPSEQLPAGISGFAPSVIGVLYATCTITAGNTVQVNALTITPPAAFASLNGFAPDSTSEMSVDLATGTFTMGAVGTVYEFKIDSVWSQDASTGERRMISFTPMGIDNVPSQVSFREELGLIASSRGQTVSCPTFVHVDQLGGFTAGVSLDAINASTDRIVDVRVRIIRWN
jgi:hypothetical protein